MAYYFINGSPCDLLDMIVAEMVWTCNPIDIDNLRNFLCLTYLHIFNEDQSKLNPKSKKSSFIGYIKGVTMFKLRDPISKRWLSTKILPIMSNSSLNTHLHHICQYLKGKTKIHMDIDPILVRIMWIVREP